MSTKRNKLFKKKNKTQKKKLGKTGKKWVTAFDAASKSLEKTGSLSKAKMVLRKQALTNARKLFGSISN